MILYLEKRFYVPGDDEFTCALGASDGWAGELKGRKLLVRERVQGWKFFYPNPASENFNDITMNYCEKRTSVPYHPLFVYVNDYIYRMPAFTPFIPIK